MHKCIDGIIHGVAIMQIQDEKKFAEMSKFRAEILLGATITAWIARRLEDTQRDERGRVKIPVEMMEMQGVDKQGKLTIFATRNFDGAILVSVEAKEYMRLYSQYSMLLINAKFEQQDAVNRALKDYSDR